MVAHARIVALFLVSLAFGASLAHAQPFADSLVQAPQLARPQRGSLAGPLSRDAFGPGELGSGVFSMHLPIELPKERGALSADPFPSYSPEHGIGPWGLGWRADLAIRRFRVIGHLDYATDERVGPWGRMAKGDDSAWYPVGLKSAVRVVESGSALVALLPDGSTWTFGSMTRETTAEGTYAWFLDSIQTVDDVRAGFTYSLKEGRAWLDRIDYGGIGVAFQYRVQIGYEPVARPFVSYLSGERAVLARRVASVEVLALDTRTNVFERRWRYLLGYDQDPWGAAFYLTSIQREFVAGAKEPALTFAYGRPAEAVAKATFQRVGQLASILAPQTVEVLQPHRSAPFDLGFDGLVDLEVAADASVIRRTVAGFVREAAPPAPANADARCRPAPSSGNAPRLLASTSPDGEPRVISLVANGRGSSTELRVCARDGTPLARQELTGQWEAGALTRVVDLTGDVTPELVQLDRGKVTIRTGSVAGGAFRLGDSTAQSLAPDVPVETLWVQDWNGDGLADLVGRTQSELVVWFGRGRGRFVAQGQIIAFRTSAGPLGDLRRYQVTFVDINHDGAADAILTRDSTASLFVNDGTALVERSVPAFAAMDWRSGAPLVIDLSGSGEVELAGIRGVDVWAVALTEPRSALLVRVADGRGVSRTMRYARAAATTGLRGRPVVLAEVSIETGGETSITSRYAYTDPKIDPATGTLLGFGRVLRSTPHRTEEVELMHTPVASGLVLRATSSDSRDPAIDRETVTIYDDVKLRGVAFIRKREERSTWKARGTGERVPGERIEYTSYQGTCPIEVRRHAADDVLVTTSILAAVPQLRQHLHCLDARRTIHGQHAAGRFDFTYTLALVRDVAGRIAGITVISGGDSLVLQRIRYDAAGLVASIDAIDRGTTTLGWESGTRQLASSIDPEGVTVRAVRRGPRTSAIEQLRRDLGGLTATESFTYDGFERLAASWDDGGGSTAANPDLAYDYVFSTFTQPGRIRTRTLVDASPGTPVTRETIDLASASGTTLATLGRTPTAWSLSSIERVRDEDVTETGLRTALAPAETPELLAYASLDPSARTIRRTITSSNGLVEQTIEQHADSRRVELHRREIAEGALREIVEVAGHVSYTLVFGPDGKVRERLEADGSRSRYAWDRLGRMRSLDLPSGKHAEIAYDALGRLSTTAWDGWVTLRHTYRASSTLPARRDVLSPAGVLLQRVGFAYDASGRVVARTHSEPGKPDRTFTFAYDVAPPSCGWQATERGHAMMEAGPGYRSCFRRDAFDRVVARTDAIDNGLTLTTELAYFDDGVVRRESRRLGRPGQPPFTALTIERGVDRSGRIAELRVVGGDSITVDYDERGRPSKATTSRGGTWIERDATTELAIGVGGKLGARAWKHVVHLASTGDPDSDRYELDGSSTLLHHTVTPRGFLATTTGSADLAFDYDAAGRLRGVTTSGARMPLAQSTMDALGRVTQVNGATVAYGSDSQATSVVQQPGGHAWTFVADAIGHQRARFLDGKLERAALAGVYIVGERIHWPFTLDGRLLGYVVGGSFEPAPMDAHRTTITQPPRTGGGSLREVSPYGVGTRVPDVLDFHGGPAQPGIDGLRFGARDYVPSIGAFLTPDATFVEDPSKCIDHVVDCNLYGFANSNPTRFTDPEGTASIGDYIAGFAGEDTWYRLTRTAVFVADHTVPGVVQAQWYKDFTGWDAGTEAAVAEIRGSSAYKDHAVAMEAAMAVVGEVAGRGTGAAGKGGGQGPTRLGRQGEAAMRRTYGEDRVGERESYTVNGNDRISDGGKGLPEIWEAKNVAQQSLTKQLIDHIEFGRATERTPNLVIRPDTRLSAPLIEEWLNGKISIGEAPMGPK